MRLTTLRPFLTAAVLTAGVFSANTASAQDTVDVGQTLDYTFRSAPFAATGQQSIADMRGKPVFIEWWGTR